MGKKYELTHIKNIGGTFRFNHRVYTEENYETPKYYIIRIEFSGIGRNSDKTMQKRGMQGLNIGTPRAEKFTGKEIYTKLKINLGETVSNIFKTLYLELIDNDVSE